MELNSSEGSREAIYENTHDLVNDNKGGARSCFFLLLVTLGILFILLLASFGIICWLSWKLGQQEEPFVKQSAELSNLRNEANYLKMENDRWKNMTEQLKGRRDNFNQSLEYILAFDNFPVNEFCTNKECQLCQKDWILYNESCYLFGDSRRSGSTWEESRQHCQNKSADLVVVDNLQEQAFIMNQTQSQVDYYNYPYYWLGLRKIDNNWIWVDGHIDTLGFWSYGEPDGLYVAFYPWDNVNSSWFAPTNPYWPPLSICEQDVFKVFF